VKASSGWADQPSGRTSGLTNMAYYPYIRTLVGEPDIPNLPTIIGDPSLAAGSFGDGHEAIQGFLVAEEVCLALLRK